MKWGDFAGLSYNKNKFVYELFSVVQHPFFFVFSRDELDGLSGN